MDPALPVIVITGNTDVERARSTLSAGAFDYVAKPFDRENLARPRCGRGLPGLKRSRANAQSAASTLAYRAE